MEMDGNDLAGQIGTSITLRECAKTFPDGTVALKSVSLDVVAGETVVILGPSGCGKTTLLRIIAGLENPDAGGNVRFGDDDVTRVPIEKRNVGMVFQSYALFPNMSVRDNVAYGLKIRRVDRRSRKQQALKVLDMMRIGELAERRIDQLSGGQRQRVALARALAVRPRVLLLDEPLTALDAALRETLRTEIDRLLRSLGITSIYVTHDQQEAMVLGDRIIVMSKGEVAQSGTPEDIYLRPANRYVGEFIGVMNRLDGELSNSRLETAAGNIDVEPTLVSKASGASSVFFRPEAVRLAAPENSPLRCKVVAVHFHGGSRRYFLETGAGPELIVDAVNATSAKAGETVGVTIDPQSFIVFD